MLTPTLASPTSKNNAGDLHLESLLMCEVLGAPKPTRGMLRIGYPGMGEPATRALREVLKGFLSAEAGTEAEHFLHNRVARVSYATMAFGIIPDLALLHRNPQRGRPVADRVVY